MQERTNDRRNRLVAKLFGKRNQVPCLLFGVVLVLALTASRALAEQVDSSQVANFAGNLSNLSTDSQDDIKGSQTAQAKVTIDGDKVHIHVGLHTDVTLLTDPTWGNCFGTHDVSLENDVKTSELPSGVGKHIFVNLRCSNSNKYCPRDTPNRSVFFDSAVSIGTDGKITQVQLSGFTALCTLP